MTEFDFFDYTKDSVHSESIGVLLLLLFLFGSHMAWKIRRSDMFRFKVWVVFLVPFYLGLDNVAPFLGRISNEYTILLMCVFGCCLTILYWREMKEMGTSLGYHRRAMIDCFDMMPDLVWMMDLDGRLTYTNQSAREKLFICSEKEAFGKTVTEVAQIQLEKGEEYTFGEICELSRRETILKDKPCRFLVFGTVIKRFLALQLYCAPIHSHLYNDNRLVGFIVTARDLTYDFKDHADISKLIEDGKLNDALELFEQHKLRYQFTGEDVIRKRKIEDPSSC